MYACRLVVRKGWIQQNMTHHPHISHTVASMNWAMLINSCDMLQWIDCKIRHDTDRCHLDEVTEDWREPKGEYDVSYLTYSPQSPSCPHPVMHSHVLLFFLAMIRDLCCDQSRDSCKDFIIELVNANREQNDVPQGTMWKHIYTGLCTLSTIMLCQESWSPLPYR